MERVLVVYDDLDLDNGAVRLRAKGGHGGHNGMRSITQHFSGSKDFPRLRIGMALLSMLLWMCIVCRIFTGPWTLGKVVLLCRDWQTCRKHPSGHPRFAGALALILLSTICKMARNFD